MISANKLTALLLAASMLLTANITLAGQGDDRPNGGGNRPSMGSDSAGMEDKIPQPAMVNPYLPDVNCDYNTQKLWFDRSSGDWLCVNDRTKTGS